MLIDMIPKSGAKDYDVYIDTVLQEKAVYLIDTNKVDDYGNKLYTIENKNDIMTN